jgi:hypothetical protein
VTRKIRHLLLGLVLALCLAPGVGARRQPPGALEENRRRDLRAGQILAHLAGIHVPSTLSTSWSDSFKDDTGMTWMENAAVLDGDVRLSQIAGLGLAEEGGDILAMTEASDGRVFLGTDGAYLDVYDPGSGAIASLGAPVPEECFG